MSKTLQHLVLVRHGESEGDVRRAAWKRGEKFLASKLPEDEEITALGIEQCQQAGLLIAERVLGEYALKSFDRYFVSSALRSEQSAVALDLHDGIWQEDSCLDERDRGKVRGLTPKQHQLLFPESFEQMKIDPIGWVPPGGESMLQLVERFKQFLENVNDAETVLAVTHRDLMWAGMQPLENLSDEQLKMVDTNKIHNAEVLHYTSINPVNGQSAPRLLWKRSFNPVAPETSTDWQIIPNLADLAA